MVDERKVVLTVGKYSIIRERYYGFRCNSLSTIWEVVENTIGVNGEPTHMAVARLYRLRDAKAKLQTLAAI
jgi:hypothetical protein